jgi:phosphate:Na+ symporter
LPARTITEYRDAGILRILALLFFPMLKPFARLLVRLLPARVDTADPSQPLYID